VIETTPVYTAPEHARGCVRRASGLVLTHHSEVGGPEVVFWEIGVGFVRMADDSLGMLRLWLIVLKQAV
jgi:hypothetical protein